MPQSDSQIDAQSPLLPIRTVANQTGVNPVTLRAWERRYRLITPRRTPKGHRLYTEADVERIRQVLELLDQGVAISQVKPLLESPAARTTETAGETWRGYQQNALDAIGRFDENALDAAYNDALSLYPVDVVNRRLIVPLLRLLGERWKAGDTGIAEEHFFSVYLRNKLGTRIHHLNQQSRGPLLLLACMPGEFHEIGLLLFALAAVNVGYGVLVLGANTPLDQLPGVLAQRPCAGVILSCSYHPPASVTERDLPTLVAAVDVPVLIGGRASARLQEKIEDAGAICLGDDVGAALKRVGQAVKSG